MDVLVPTSATAWAAPYQEGVVVGFPSGGVARIRAMTFETFLRIGHIPDPLTEFMIEIMDGGKFADGKLKTPEPHSKQQWDEWFALLNSICVSCFVSPAVVLPSSDPLPPDTITVDMLSYEDKLHLYACLGGSVERLKAFFRQSAERVAALAATTGNASVSSTDHADRGMGDEPVGDAGHVDGDVLQPGSDAIRHMDRKQTNDPGQARQPTTLVKATAH